MGNITKIKRGDIIYLQDERTIKDLLAAKEPGATQGLQMQVTRTRTIKEQNNIVTWLLADLMAPKKPDLYLLIKIVDSNYDLRLYWRPDDIPVATRQELLDANMHWMFGQPETDRFKPCDLKFSAELVDGDAVYTPKHGELHGECTEIPRPSGVKQPSFATVVEYYTPAKVADQHVLILELGGIDRRGDRIEDGGVVTFFKGSDIKAADINHLAS